MWTDGGQRPILNPHLSNQCSITRKTAPTICGHFHDDWANNVTSRCSHVFTIYCPAHWRPCFFTDLDHFELVRDINKTNVLTNFHDDWANSVIFRVFTRDNCHYIHIEKNAPPTGGHVFSLSWTIFKLVRDINKTNVLTNFHDDWAKIVSTRVFTRKTAPPTGGHFFQRTGPTFKLNQHIIKANISTTFHENWAKNVTSRVKNAPPTGGHVFSPIWTIFELVRDINKTNVLTNFHDDWAKIVTLFTRERCPPNGAHVFSPIWTIFELVRDINKINYFTDLHDDWAKIVTSRVFTRKTAPPTGGHVNQRTGTTFELNQAIIKTNILINFKLNRDFIGKKLLTKFHEDRTRNVASRVFTSKC
ncbi:hypothetical protein DPMN_166037 [Dreissena polymorpha]|uniref:Uncharacterized protein n=1 Tax=Dreissena polymorpha TaxID=45954 RepID=A0A9D4EY42_DREPO|nr:hypothetical protein DPMN_166037 [Dreissena polymorpha]